MRCRNACREKLRTRLLVVEPGHPVLGMLPEERLEGGQQLDEVQPTVGVDVPGGVFHQPFLGGPGQLTWYDLRVDGIGDAQRRVLRDEPEITDILDVAGSEITLLATAQQRPDHTPHPIFLELVGQLIEVGLARDDEPLLRRLDVPPPRSCAAGRGRHHA